MTTAVQTPEAQSTGDNAGASTEQLPQFDLETCTREQFVDHIKTDEAMRAEFMENPYQEKFSRISAILDGKRVDSATIDDGQQQPPTGQQSQQPAQQAQQNADSGADDGTSVVINGKKIPRELFGSYLSGDRSVEDAIVEALKGNSEKDKTISSFIERNNLLNSDTLNLRRQLMTALQDKGTAQRKADEAASMSSSPQFDVTDVDFDVLNDVDAYDLDKSPEAIAKAKTALQKLKNSLSGKASVPTGQSQQQPPAHSAQPQGGQQPNRQPAPATDPDVEKTREALNQQVVNAEYADIMALQANNPELQTPIPFDQLDRAVGVFHQSAARLAGTPGNEASAMELYFSQTPAGEQFRATCKQSGIEAPEGYMVHQFLVREVRPKRLENMSNYSKVVESKTGKKLEPWELLDAPGISYSELYRNTGKYQPAQQQSQASPTQQPAPSSKLQETIRQHSAQPQLPPTATVPDIPPSMGGPQINGLQSIDQGELPYLISKWQECPNDLTREEANKIRVIYESQGMPVPAPALRKLKE